VPSAHSHHSHFHEVETQSFVLILTRYGDHVPARSFTRRDNHAHSQPPRCSTSKTQWTCSISVVLQPCRRALSVKIEVFSTSIPWILASLKPRPVFISLMLVCFHLGILLTASSEYVRSYCTEFLMNHHVVHSFGPTATSGH